MPQHGHAAPVPSVMKGRLETMRNLSRREFLRRLTAAGFAALWSDLLLSACAGRQAASPTSPLLPTSLPALAPTHTLSAAQATAVATPVAAATSTAAPLLVPDLAVIRGGEPAELVRRALASLGGMQRFVKPGADVIVKPNICVAYHTYEYAATANPWVVAELVRLCLEAGARRVRVMDGPFGGTAEQAYQRSGIREQVLAAGGQMEIMSSVKYQVTPIPQGRDIHEWSVYADALKADLLIDVPIAKHHNLARLTLGMKNLMGLVQNRSGLHPNLGQRLADLASLIRPGLIVVDAVRILTDHGPTGGNLDDVKVLNTLIASTDIVAADAYAATLFGLRGEDLAYVRAGEAMGLGRSDLQNLRIEEISI